MAVEVNIVMGRSRSNNGEFEIELRCGFVVFFFGIINNKHNGKEKMNIAQRNKAVISKNAARKRETPANLKGRVCSKKLKSRKQEQTSVPASWEFDV